MTGFSKLVALRVLRRLRHGQLEIVDDGRRLIVGSSGPRARVVVRSRRAWRKLARGSRGLAEGYADGLWETPDLTAVLRVAAGNMDGADALRRRLGFIRAPYQRLRGLFVANTPRRSRRDIHAHYDLGNDMFERMLDPTMTYSSAYFERPDMTLEEASIAKLDLVCEKLAIGPDDHVLEIGTGWGSFAIRAASTRGCRVTTTTISAEQHAVAAERIARAGLRDRVTLLDRDYRELRGSYDKVVSIEMIEAVGWKHFDCFFERCDRLLRPDGAMLLQAIVHRDSAYEVEKASRSSFIRTYIFPHGCLPSLTVISDCLRRRTDMTAVHLQDLTAHYPRTLAAWRANFRAAAAELRERGYDERFQRLWEMYLSYCEAGFAERRIRVVQALLAKPGWTGLRDPTTTTGTPAGS